MNRAVKRAADILVLIGAAILLIGAGVEFFNVASGTGAAIGAFSITWFLLFSVFVLFSIALFAALVLWQRGGLSAVVEKILFYRSRVKFLRWLLIKRPPNQNSKKNLTAKPNLLQPKCL